MEQEELKEKDQLQKIRTYEEGLEEILDIRCSLYNPYKSRFRRYEIQDELISNVRNGPRDQVIEVGDLQKVYEYDWRFCRNTRKSNGELRQLYAKTWKLKVERDKHKNVVEKVKIILTKWLKPVDCGFVSVALAYSKFSTHEPRLMIIVVYNWNCSNYSSLWNSLFMDYLWCKYHFSDTNMAKLS